MRQVLGYTLMLLRAYTRDFTALFFGFFFPLIFMGLFGILNFGAFGHVAVGIVDEANNADSQAFRAGLAKIETLQLSSGPSDAQLESLRKGDRDIVLVIPADFKIAPARQGATVATPISRRNYMAAHVLERLLLAVVQVLILLAVAVFAFKVSIVGSLGLVLAIAILGSVLFLCLGFAVTGFVTTENQAPAIMQLVTLPQMFLSGVFFSRDAVPAFLKPVSDVLPLTFLNDALRQVSTAGAGIVDVGGDLIGIVIWSAITFVIAFRFFKLEA